jgi:alcohol dehydrogenase (cytochrome c)
VTNRSTRLFCLLALSAATPFAARAAAQGPYTQAQAARGATLAEKHCAACHDPARGGSALPLSGERFLRKWASGSRTADDLFYIVRSSMPFGAPNSLAPQEYADIVAHILRQNGIRGGTAELRPDAKTLADVRFEYRDPGVSSARMKRDAAVDSSAKPGTAAAPRGIGPNQEELNRADGDRSNWLLPNHGYSGQRYIEAVRITRDNVRSLVPICKYELGDKFAFHTNPIVYRGVLYATTALTTVALDATTCQVKWRHDWKLKRAFVWPQNRGVGIKDGRVVRGTTDGFLIALDAENGSLLWERAAADPGSGQGRDVHDGAARVRRSRDCRPCRRGERDQGMDRGVQAV